MITLKAAALEGSGPGLFRLTGSFTTLSNGLPTLIRPNKGNFTVTRKTNGVYVIGYQQSTLSVVRADVSVGPSSALIAGNGALDVKPAGFALITADFATANAANYATDTTNKNLVIAVFPNATSSATVDVYTLGNTSSKASYRVSFDVTLASSTMNQ